MNKNNCCGCGVCSSVCPTNAIEMCTDEEGFKYPEIKKEKCIGCGLCEKRCPCENELNKGVQLNQVYACKNKNDTLRRISTSGGFFLAVADYVIRQKGVICAAEYDPKFRVVHGMASTFEDAKRFTGSKYVQSEVFECYRDVKLKLEQGVVVLFVGTPCQVYALKCYLTKEYKELITLDIVCMGVGSPGIWEKYINKLNKNGKMTDFIFKDKDKGWHNYNIKIDYKGKTKKMIPNRNVYMKGYLSRVFLRPYCYECKFKGIQRVSDITISDCWGIDKMIPQMDDNRGVSAVYIHSEKGRKIFDEIEEQLDFNEINVEDAILNNKHISTVAKKPIGRKKFFDDLKKYGVIKALNLYFGQGIGYKVIRKVFKLYV